MTIEEMIEKSKQHASEVNELNNKREEAWRVVNDIDQQINSRHESIHRMRRIMDVMIWENCDSIEAMLKIDEDDVKAQTEAEDAYVTKASSYPIYATAKGRY